MKIENLSTVFNNAANINKKDTNKNVGFGNFLNEQLDKVNDLQKKDEYLKKMLSVGEVDNVHNVMIASEKADLALQLTLSIENKLMDAYKEIMRMQI